MARPRDPSEKKEGYGFVCLTRDVGESVIIHLPDGREIKIVNTRQRRCGVTLGIEAPKDIKIVRCDLDPSTDTTVIGEGKDKRRVKNENDIRCPKCRSLSVAVARDMRTTRKCSACQWSWLPAEDSK